MKGFFIYLVSLAIALALGWCYAYENTIVFPIDEDDDVEFGTYQTHDNETGRSKSGSYFYQKPEREEEPDDSYFSEKWEDMREDAGLGRRERDRD